MTSLDSDLGVYPSSIIHTQSRHGNDMQIKGPPHQQLAVGLQGEID